MMMMRGLRQFGAANPQGRARRGPVSSERHRRNLEGSKSGGRTRGSKKTHEGGGTGRGCIGNARCDDGCGAAAGRE